MTRSAALFPLTVLLATLAAPGCTGSTPVVSIKIIPASATIKVGETKLFQAMALDALDKPIAGAPIGWISSDPSVATLSNAGLATGGAAGTALLTAYSGNVTGTANLAVLPNVKYTLSLSIVGAGTGRVTSAPDGIDCASGTCTGVFASGTQVTLSPQGLNSSAFAGFSGACSGTAPCTVTMDGNHAVTANFTPPPRLTVTVNGTGVVGSFPSGITCNAGPCTATFTGGAQVTLTATPAPGGTFVGWSGGPCTGTGACTFTLTSDQSVTASFSTVSTTNPTLSVTLAGAGGGTVTSTPGGISCVSATCNSSFPTNTSVSLSAAPAGGSVFTGWSGACTGTGACTVAMSVNKSVTATFAVATFTLSVTVDAGGAVTSNPAGINCASGTCSAAFTGGTSVTLTPAAGAGYAFSGWSNACAGAAGCTVAMSSDKTVNASFSGPFDFAVATSTGASAFSLVPGEARTLGVTVTVARGSGLPVSLSLSALPANVTASFSPATVTPPATSTLTLTATNGAALGQTAMTATGTAGTVVHTGGFTLELRSPNQLTSPNGLAVESSGTTALVANQDRLERVDLATLAVTKTVTSGLGSPVGVVLEQGGATALVTEGNNLTRVDLATGAQTRLTTQLNAPAGLALEGSGSSALVADCGPTSCGTTGRLVRVTLATGAITQLAGINTPRGVAIEPGGATALVAERGGTTRLLRVTLAGGGITPVSSPVSYGLSSSPESIAIESGGQTALVTSNSDLTRVSLGTGVQTRISSFPAGPFGGLALASNGNALVTDRSRNAVVRVQVGPQVTTLAPSPTSVESLFTPFGVATESTTSALLTDCGASGCGTTGRVLRANLATGQVTELLPNMNNPRGIALETATTALVLEQGTKRLLRLDLTGAALTPIGPPFTQAPEAVAFEGSGSAVVTAGNGVVRVNLGSGAQTPLATVAGGQLGGIASESSTSALVVDQAQGQLLRVNLTTGASTVLATGFQTPQDVRLEGSGKTALVTERGLSGRLYRVDLVTNPGQLSLVGAALGAPRAIALDGSGNALVTEGNRLLRVSFSVSGAVVPASLATAQRAPSGIAVEAGDASLLMLVDCGFGNTSPTCNTNGSLVRVNAATGAQTPLATGLATPHALAIEAGGATALVTDCGAANQCSTGRLVRVTLATGAISNLANNLENPDGIFIEPGGATALVVEHANSGRLLRVTLSGPQVGQFTILASNLTNPRQVSLETGGATALLAVDGGLARVTLATGVATQVVKTNLQRFAVEPGGGGASALVISTGTGLSASLARLNLATGALTVLSSGLNDSAYALALDSAGKVFLTESRTTNGLLLKFNKP